MASRVASAVTLLAVLVMLLATATAVAAPAWLAPAPLRPPTEKDGPSFNYHAVAAASDGTVVAVSVLSQSGSTAPTEVLAQVRPPGGVFTAPQLLSRESQLYSVGPPRVAVDAAGNAVAAWIESDGTRSLVRAAFMPAGASAFGPAQDLSGSGGGVEDLSDGPDVAMAAGAAVVVWTLGGVAQASIRAMGASSFGAAVDLSAPAEIVREPHVAMASDGTAFVVWRSEWGPPPMVQVAIRPPGGLFGAPVDVYVNGAPSEEVLAPAIAVAPSGRATVLWWDHDSEHHYRLLAKAGTSGGDFGPSEPDVVASSEDDYGVYALAVDDQDTALVVHATSDGMRATERPSKGTFSDRSQKISGPAGGVVAAFTPSGEAIAAWLGVSGSAPVMQAAEMPRGGAFGAAHDLDFGPRSSHQAVSFSMPAGPAIDGEGNATLLYGIAGIDGPSALVPGEFGDWTVTRDASAPSLSVSVPATAVAGAPVTMGATAADRWTSAGVTWSFGDGSANATGAGVSHVFSAPGSHLVTATATDAVGNETSRTATVVVSPAPLLQRPGPPARAALAGGTVSARWSVGRSTTAVKRLVVASVRKGATIAVSCAGGTRKGCRFTRKTIRTKKAGSASLAKYFNFTTRRHHKIISRLRSGAVVTVIVTSTTLRGRTFRAVVRNHRSPKVSRGCLAVGSRTRTTGC